MKKYPLALFRSHPLPHYQWWEWGAHPWIWFLGVLLLSSWWIDRQAVSWKWLQGQVFDLEEVNFTGTAAPVEKVPNWVVLSDQERTFDYQQLASNKLITLPEYNIRQMQAGTVWKPDNQSERNTYITYPVPYLGNYQLDGTEGTGSHLAVDIKIPSGTPIQAIAAGTVVKTGYQSDGFGHHVVIGHKNVPDPETNQRTTLYSSYSHLSKISVRNGQTVKKGEIIGKSGKSGMSTAPHLHFQIDRSSAPFYPYWPFTWKEVQSAGYSSYFEAVQKGLGIEKAKQHTVHPMHYIRDWQQFSAENSAPSPTIIEKQAVAQAPQETPEKVTEKTIETPPPAAKEVESENKNQSTASPELTLEIPRFFTPETEFNWRLGINDVNTLPKTGIKLIASTSNVIIRPKQISAENFSQGWATGTIEARTENPFRITAQIEGKTAAKSSFLVLQYFQDIDRSDASSEAIIELKKQGIIDGYADGTFRAEQPVNRAEATKLLLGANNVLPQKSLSSTFHDLDSNAWFYDWIATAEKEQFVKGYSDQSFRPGNTINRAEFLKLAMSTAQIDPSEFSAENWYADVPTDSWFAPYVQWAAENQVITTPKGSTWEPAKEITRGEAAEILYRLRQQLPLTARR